MEPEMSIRGDKGIRIPLLARICETCEGQPHPGLICDCIDGIEFWLPTGTAKARLPILIQNAISECVGYEKGWSVDPAFILEAPDVYGNRREEAWEG